MALQNSSYGSLIVQDRVFSGCCVRWLECAVYAGWAFEWIGRGKTVVCFAVSAETIEVATRGENTYIYI